MRKHSECVCVVSALLYLNEPEEEEALHYNLLIPVMLETELIITL